jgi:hypothetical protein
MSRARLRALAIAAAVILLAVVIAFALVPRAPAPVSRAPSERPTLLLLTSLPLVFPEQFALEGGGSPALQALASRYKVAPISVASPAELAKGRLLLMAHPLAQPAEDLVALDEWVRRGGRLLLLADPMLEWPSQRPLGDPLRPPAMFMDTGLLAHWGLGLESPAARGRKPARLGGYEVVTDSPGALSGQCAVSADRLVAHCRIGKGRATVVADADLLDVDRLDGAQHNLDALLAELGQLQQP